MTKPRFLDCSVLISEAYRDKLMKHLKTAFKDDSDVYNRINLKDDVFSYDPLYLIMLPKNSDPYLYGDYIEAYGKKSFLGCFRCIDSPVSLNLVGTTNVLSKGLLFSDDLDDPEFLKAYESFLETLFRKHDKVARYSLRNEYAKLDKKKMNSYKNSFWDFCCDVTREFNLGKSMNRRFIRCQEDLWNVVSKTKISKKEKYEYYRAAYLGKELQDHFVQSLKEI